MSNERPNTSDSEPSVTTSLPETLNQSDVAAFPSDQEFDFDGKEADFYESQRIGRYRLKREIARGGMGIIICAYDELLQRDVAVKLLRRKHLNHRAIYESFINEALLTSRLQHPCIVPIYDLGHAEDQRPFFAMRLIAGQSLAEILAISSGEGSDRSHLLKIFELVCQALAYAHSQGILHLDIKPSNIMTGQFGEVHVMDWGLAQDWSPLNPIGTAAEGNRSSSDSREAGNNICREVRGTPAYMSPEQARGELVCPRTDVFGLGALLCEILTGRAPYQGSAPKQVLAHAMRAKLDEAFRGLDECGRDEVLVNLAKLCLAPSKDDRPESASAVAFAIGDYLEAALAQSESDVCRFFDLTLDLFCIATLDGYFNRVNVNFTRVLGYPDQTLVSQPYLAFVHPDDVVSTLQAMQQLSEGKPVVQFCNRYRHAQGHYISLEWTAQPIPEEGCIFAVARDITQRLSHAEKKETAD